MIFWKGTILTNRKKPATISSVESKEYRMKGVNQTIKLQIYGGLL